MGRSEGEAVRAFGRLWCVVGCGNGCRLLATTIPRSAFRAGLNCVAIHFANEQDGTVGNSPPGGMKAAIYIEMVTAASAGDPRRYAWCGHKHRHVDLEGRSIPEQHPASAVTETSRPTVDRRASAMLQPLSAMRRVTASRGECGCVV